MRPITSDSRVVTIVVTVDASLQVMPDLEVHAATGIERFADWPGYVGGALHISADGTRLVQYLQWRSESEYRACIDDDSWNNVPSARRFLEVVASGDAKVDERVFRVVVAFDAKDRPDDDAGA